MECFSQTKDNRTNIINEICKRIGIKDDREFKKLSTEENLNILDKLKRLEGNKNPSNLSKITQKDLEQIKKGDVDYTIKLLKENKFDSIKILEIVNNTLKPLNSDNNFSQDTEKLNESLTELKTILSKQNKRWGHSYHLRNSYQEILNFIDKKTYEFQLKDAIHSVDNSYHTIILNEYVSGGTINPIYRNFSSVKNVLTDVQGLVFDMVVLINRYMRNNDIPLTYINTDSLNKYNHLSDLVLKNILSSAFNSILFNNSSAVKDFLGKQDNTKDYYLEHNSILDFFSTNINSKDIKYDISNINIRSIDAMNQFIASTKQSFNLNIRKILTAYNNIVLELLRKLDKIKSNPNIYNY